MPIAAALTAQDVSARSASLAGASVRFRSLHRQPAYKAVSSVMEQHILSGELKPVSGRYLHAERAAALPAA